MKSVCTLVFIIVCFNLFSQRGKNGTFTITSTNTIVNQYTSLTQNAFIGNTTLTVASSASYSIGDLVFIIQMQGASVNAGKDTLYPDFNSSIPTTTSFGDITNYNSCGNNEFAQISSIPDGTSIMVDCGIKNNYQYLGNTQVIKVPRYTALTINGSGSISCPPWNGSIGGIAVVEVETNATLNSSPSFSVSGKGFRGGATENSSTFGANKYGSVLPVQGAYKGESIAGDTTRYKVYSAVFARGAIANGGGGGCGHNAGGGGGANGGNILAYTGFGNPIAGYNSAWNTESSGFALSSSAGGGRGGYSFSNSNKNVSSVSPGTSTTTSNSWGGDARRNVGGFGGRPLDYSSGKLFLGGGGGSGDGNDNKSGGGGNGGGMVYMICYGNLSGAGSIVADGADGFNSIPGCSSNDGAGGGGGGGTIILDVHGTTFLSAPVALSAKGGNGGNVNFNCFLSNSDAYGPGAGGGAGYIATSGTVPTNSITGGVNGNVVGNSSNIASNFPPNGATKGGSGSTGSFPTYTLTVSSNQTLCPNEAYTVTASFTEPGASINWFNSNSGGTAVATGTSYASPGYTTSGTYTVYAASCPGTYRQPIVIVVGSLNGLSVNSPSICSGQTATLTANGAASYTWMPGNVNGNTYTISPGTTTTVSLIGVNATCSAQVISTITVGSNISISVNSAAICSGQTATLTANGATTYTWNSGVYTNTINVSPTTVTIYTVFGSTGTCSGSNTATVLVNPIPQLNINTATVCSGQQASLTVSGANTYTWSNNVNGNSQIVNPSTTTNYTVFATDNNGCTNFATTTVSIIPTPIITINTSTICSGQTASLTAVGVTNYTWSTSENTQTIHPSPTVTTSYSVIGSNGGCTSTATTQVNVLTSPTMSISAANTNGCSDLCVVFTDSVTPSGSGIIYNFGDNSTGNINNPTHCYTSTGIYTVTANAVNSVSGCSSVTYTLSPVITVSQSPTANFTIQEGNTITVGTSVHLTNASSNAGNYTWNLCNGNISSLTDVTVNYADTGNCCINLLAANAACTSSVTKCITIINETSIHIPNVFTPNGDKINDVFKINTVGIASLHCSIYDRWGLKLYEWDGITGNWDGNTKSGLATNGTYFCIIDYTDLKGSSKTEKGFLSLFRD